MDEKADDSVEEPQPFVDLFGVVDENDEKLVKKVDSAASTMNPNYRDDRKLSAVANRLVWDPDLPHDQSYMHIYKYIYTLHPFSHLYIHKYTHVHIYRHT